MQKKSSITLLILFITFMGGVNAQTEQGGFLLGANVANISIPLDNNNASSISLTPSVGYFVADNIAIGLTLPIYRSAYSTDNNSYSSTSTSIGLGMYGRYYIPLDQISFFMGAGFGFNSYTRREEGEDFFGNKYNNSTSDSNPYANLNGGIVYFLNKSIGVEGVLNVGDLLNPGTSLSLGLGLQIYFNQGQVE